LIVAFVFVFFVVFVNAALLLRLSPSSSSHPYRCSYRDLYRRRLSSLTLPHHHLIVVSGEDGRARTFILALSAPPSSLLLLVPLLPLSPLLLMSPSPSPSSSSASLPRHHLNLIVVSLAYLGPRTWWIVFFREKSAVVFCMRADKKAPLGALTQTNEG
jgi:hypothetical protein